jgi:hypothetical protein
MQARSFLLGVSLSLLFGIGCLVGRATGPDATLTAAPAPPGTTRWEHFCFERAGEVEAINKLAGKMGQKGWELTSGASDTAHLDHRMYLLCFKRPLGPTGEASPTETP